MRKTSVLFLLAFITTSPHTANAVSPGTLTKVARITGATPPGETLPNPNQTDQRDALFGTDLGILWDAGGGQMMIAFGDTYGPGWNGNGAGPDSADWRSNTLALVSKFDPAYGLVFTHMVQDKPGHAQELLHARRDAQEWTRIPTAGVTVGARQILHLMSVHHWGAPGFWQTNRGELAYSDNQGATWKTAPEGVWANTPAFDDPFQQAAFVKDGGFVYMFGTPNGRQGGASLARVPQGAVLNKSAYEYWTGARWAKGDESAVRPVIPSPVSELSVAYNSYFHRWLMISLDETRHAIVLRDAPKLTGPWSDEKKLVDGQEYPALYGGYIDPIHNTGPDLYFTMSQWAPYNVFWMHATLKK